ncbi:MAG: hypothetical protein AB2817_02085 [Candidatus Thiodiazotropha sp.]
MKWLEFNPNKSLIELPIFWITIIFLFGLSFIIALIIFSESDLFIDLTYEGFNNLFVFYRLPLTVLALIIPVIALIASNHRSEQTKAQILLASNQNVFSNYYKHIEEFEKYTSSHLAVNSIRIENTRTCHSILFPNATMGVYKISNDTYQLFSDTCKKLIVLFGYFNGGHPNTQSDTIVEIETNLINIERYLHLSWSSGGGKGFTHNGIQIVVKDGQLRIFLNNIVKRLTAINTIMLFDHNYISPPPFNKVTNINLSIIPIYDITLNKENVINFNLFNEQV